MGDRIANIIAFCVVAGLCVTNTMLLRQNAQLKDNVSLAVNRQITQGDKLKNFGAVNMEGRFTKVNLSQDGRQTVLIAFSYMCPECRENFDKFAQLADSLE